MTSKDYYLSHNLYFDKYLCSYPTRQWWLQAWYWYPNLRVPSCLMAVMWGLHSPLIIHPGWTWGLSNMWKSLVMY